MLARVRPTIALIAGLGVATLAWSCSSSSGGGASASSVAPASGGTTGTSTPGSRTHVPSQPAPAPRTTSPGSSTPAAAGRAVSGMPSSPPPPPASQPATPPLSGDIPFGYTLKDPASSPTDVEVEYSLDSGTTWYFCSAAPGGEGTKQLAASPAGVAHKFVWDSVADLGSTLAKGVVIAIVPTGQPAAFSPAFDVDDRSQATPAPAPAAPTSNVVIDRGPYLQATTTTGTRIVWRTTTPTDSLVELGPGSSLGTVVGNAQASETQHVVTVTGLTAATQYSYRITSAGAPVTTPATFATAPDATASSFSCIVFGDSGEPSSVGQFPLAQRMAHESYDFILHVGDVIYPNGEDANYIPYFFTPYASMILTHPMFPAVGNHEYLTANAQPYQDVFYPTTNNPQQSKFYYSFDWGDAHFVSIDTNQTCVNPGPGLTWLANDLAANTKRWLVVFMHQPPYSVGHHGDNATLIQNLVPILEQYEVDLMLCGHDHDYERSAPIKNYSTDPAFPGIPYIISGGGGAKLYTVQTPRSTTQCWDSSFHYTKLTFGHDAISGRAIRADGSVIETFTIPHK